MSATQPSFRWRTILELAVIGAVVYFLIGAPGLSDVISSSKKGVVPAPKIHLKPDSLVYPDLNLDCAKHTYDIHIFSAKPLIVYIDGFLTESEADALVEQR
jgi:prolyl 4-hydroxylase